MRKYSKEEMIQTVDASLEHYFPRAKYPRPVDIHGLVVERTQYWFYRFVIEKITHDLGNCIGKASLQAGCNTDERVEAAMNHFNRQVDGAEMIWIIEEQRWRLIVHA